MLKQLPPGCVSCEQLEKISDLASTNAISREQLLEVACAVARIGSLLCEVGGKAVANTQHLEEPYIWELDN